MQVYSCRRDATLEALTPLPLKRRKKSSQKSKKYTLFPFFDDVFSWDMRRPKLDTHFLGIIRCHSWWDYSHHATEKRQNRRLRRPFFQFRLRLSFPFQMEWSPESHIPFLTSELGRKMYLGPQNQETCNHKFTSHSGRRPKTIAVVGAASRTAQTLFTCPNLTVINLHCFYFLFSFRKFNSVYRQKIANKATLKVYSCRKEAVLEALAPLPLKRRKK